MEFSRFPINIVMKLCRLFLFLIFSCFYGSSSSSTIDGVALLSFKSQISGDPSGALDSWNNSALLHSCLWPGVTCGRKHPDRVTALNLASLSLEGNLSPSLANLTFLRVLNIPNNQLHGGIPPELSSMRHLQQLNLSSNSLEGSISPPLGNLSSLSVLDLSFNALSGTIPSSLCNISSLTFLSLKYNKLSGLLPPDMGLALPHLQYLSMFSNQLEGPIPSEFGSFSSLTFLSLANNSLTGFIPPSLTNISSLSALSLSINKLSGGIPSTIWKLSSLEAFGAYENTLSGSIPPSLGNLSSLADMDISENSLSGSIPDSLGGLSAAINLFLSYNDLSGSLPASIWNISSLVDFEVGTNQISGTLPPDMGNNLPNLQTIYLYNNTVHGTIPMSLANATQLMDIELQYNQFDGKIPPSLALQGLNVLLLRNNRLESASDADHHGWEFFNALSNCTSLRVLQLDNNKFEGMLPSSISNLSRGLHVFTMAGNQLSGGMPAEFGYKYPNMLSLNLGGNLLSGTIPASIGMLQTLQSLALGGNMLSGEIPLTLGNLTLLNGLYLGGNGLNGSIPASLGKCKVLSLLSLENNKLSGTLPREILSIASLSQVLSLSGNSLIGPLPEEVGSLVNLNSFYIAENSFSGEIPSNLGKCTSLVYLYMQGNNFQGTIPSSMSGLKGVQELDLSRNNLSGDIPIFLEKFSSLYLLNLSYNNFQGEVPQGGVFGNVSGTILVGMKNLCGGNKTLHLPSCLFGSHEREHRSKNVVLFSVLGAFVGTICVLGLLGMYYWRRALRENVLTTPGSAREKHPKISYAELLKATDGFNENNLIGTGGFGSVYKGILAENGNDGKTVAVKVLNLQQRGASRSFIAECEALRNIRHRNLVKILTSCSSVDFRGNDFKALVYEFMPNGSLEKWLHDQEVESLKLIQRLNIAIDVASALQYLHCHGQTPIVHCDLKPSNVLLDGDMTARVSDFGLARFLDDNAVDSSAEPTSTIGLKGSVGYVAPEYGVANKVSTQGDVYSYGILLLELLTGKRPVGDAFLEGWSLRKYVEVAIPDGVADIMDDALMLAEEEHGDVQTEHIDDAGRKSRDCIASMLRIGLLCSKESANRAYADGGGDKGTA